MDQLMDERTAGCVIPFNCLRASSSPKIRRPSTTLSNSPPFVLTKPGVESEKVEMMDW